MKLSKEENPLGVKVGQKWKSKDERRPRRFTVLRITRYQVEIYAEVDYGDLVCLINLNRFDRHVKCK